MAELVIEDNDDVQKNRVTYHSAATLTYAKPPVDLTLA